MSGLRHGPRRSVGSAATGTLVAAALSLLAAHPVAAQDGGQVRRLAFDTVVGIQDFVMDDGESRVAVILDTYTSIQIRPGTQVSFRPKLWRMNGDWLPLVDEVAVRHEFTTSINWRVTAGRFPSPIGLGMTENRASTNAALYWCHRPLYMALPSFRPDVPDLSLVSAVYPNGVLLNAGTGGWDARVAVIDAAPVQFWHPPSGDVSRTANAVVGGGVTPREGLRLGGALAWGRVGRTGANPSDQPYRMLNAEAEYAFGHTRISGEWTHDRFPSPAGDRTALGWTLQARHTLTPRVFAHGRVTTMRSPATLSSAYDVSGHHRFTAVDSTVGYLLSPDFTVRVGHSAVQPWTVRGLEHRIGASLMWARRWW